MFKQACSIAVIVMLVAMGGQRTDAQERPVDEQIRIRRTTGLGARAKVATPIYQTSMGGGVKRAQDWHVISVMYDTAPEWIDDLLVQFFVLSSRTDLETRQNMYSLFRKSVRYGDIERGRDHRAMAFLRPVALKRFGDVAAWAAVFSLDGRVVEETSEESVPLPEFWWRNPIVMDNPALTVREGYLLNRQESPWMLVNPDDYEIIR